MSIEQRHIFAGHGLTNERNDAHLVEVVLLLEINQELAEAGDDAVVDRNAMSPQQLRIPDSPWDLRSKG